MNDKLIATAALVAFAATSAMASGEVTVVPEAKSLKSRAEVVAEVLQARTQGLLIPAGEYVPVVQTSAKADKTRAAVRSEVLAARSAGTLLRAGEVLGGE